MINIDKLTKEDIENINMIVFDVDGVLVCRGTKISSNSNYLELGIKSIDPKQIDQIDQLYTKGFLININSGRGLYMLQLMFREILPYVSLTYENGSASWTNGRIIQHVNSHRYLGPVYEDLLNINDKNIKGWEPKEFIITIHCTKRVPAIEKVIKQFKDLYYIWNGEAYDIGVKNKQTKAVGLKGLMRSFNLKKENVMVIGDNYNDEPMMKVGRISVTADKDRVPGDFWVPLNDERLPADILMEKILLLQE